MKKKIAFLIGFVFFLLLAKTTSASTITSATIEVSPTKGDITTKILVRVRGTPYKADFVTSSGDVPVLYLYYDDKIIVQRMKCVTYPKYFDYSTYECSFDATISVPNEYPYSELGEHLIKAVVEASDGTKAQASTTFRVVNYIPPPKWWEDLPEDFLKKITGPQGPRGAKGDKGDPGYTPYNEMYLSIGVGVVAVTLSIVSLSRTRRRGR